MKDKKKLYYWILIFMIGCFIGWVYEEIFCYFEDGYLSNRGFLYGPYLPVYGWGSVILNKLLKKYKKNIFLVFILSILITGIVEYFTGFLMESVYNRTWWDYTGLFLNINGYVCLRSVLTFAIGAVLLIVIIEPKLEVLLKKKYSLCKAISIIFCIVFVIDNIITFLFRY